MGSASFWKRWKRLGLRTKILAVLMPGIVTIICAELWLTRIDAVEAADAAFDRSLLGALRSVERNISTASGGLSVELPYKLFELFQLTAHGPVYFRVATLDGLVEIGSPDLPMPPGLPADGSATFHDAMYFGEPVRVASVRRTLDRPLLDGKRELVIQIAESVESRRTFTRVFVIRAAVRDAFVISFVGLALALLVSWSLEPVARLAREVAMRSDADLSPLAGRDLPRDIQPLVDSINGQLQRTRELMDRQRAFLDDASHQLRTPLATLHTQVGFAIRQSDPEIVRTTLSSIAQQLDQATRGTNQLLAMARSDAAPLESEGFDAAEMAREIARRFLPLARGRDIDLGVEAPDAGCRVVGDRTLLTEALANLVHNAVTYAEPASSVTIEVAVASRRGRLSVSNSHASVAPAVAANVGQRFLKSAGSSGAGLGLAIAKSIMLRHGGSLTLAHAGGEVRFTMTWPQRGYA